MASRGFERRPAVGAGSTSVDCRGGKPRGRRRNDAIRQSPPGVGDDTATRTRKPIAKSNTHTRLSQHQGRTRLSGDHVTRRTPTTASFRAQIKSTLDSGGRGDRQQAPRSHRNARGDGRASDHQVIEEAPVERPASGTGWSERGSPGGCPGGPLPVRRQKPKVRADAAESLMRYRTGKKAG